MEQLIATELTTVSAVWHAHIITILIYYTNICRYLESPQKTIRYNNLKARCSNAERRVKRLKDSITKMMDKDAVEVNERMNDDLSRLMEDHHQQVTSEFPEDSFQKLFWEQQLKMASTRDARQMRWHPMIIKWCLYLKMISSAAYGAMRRSGFVKLPSERTLRDYTHLFKADTGIQDEVTKQLMRCCQP